MNKPTTQNLGRLSALTSVKTVLIISEDLLEKNKQKYKFDNNKKAKHSKHCNSVITKSALRKLLHKKDSRFCKNG